MTAVEIFAKGLAVMLIAAAVITVALFAVGATIEHFTPHPTADQLYGCTAAQQAPGGECK